MEPYYDDGNTIVYHGDCRDILPNISADVMITDPPWPNCEHIKIDNCENAKDMFDSAVKSISVKRIAVQLGTKCDPRFLNEVKLPFFRTCKMEFIIPSKRGRLLYTHDDVYLYGCAPKSKQGMHLIPGGCKATPSFNQFKGIKHPCPRRLEHMTWLVRWWSEPEDIIIDPFCGSGTTLVACKLLGRKSIGIDSRIEFCKEAIERLQQEVINFNGV